MPKIVPFLALNFLLNSALMAQAAPKKADRKVVTPGVGEIKSASPKAAGIVAPVVASTAFVRILHAVPNGSKIDVYAGSLKVASNRGFTGITSYISIKGGKNALKVFKAGTTSPTIVADSFTFGRGKYYTLAIYGKKAPSLLSINESNGKTNLEKARVRAVHLVPGAPELLVTAPSTRGDLGYAKFISKPLEYGQSGSKLTAPKTTTIQIRIEEKLLKETPEMNFQAGKRYSVFIVGEIGGKDKNALDILLKPAAEQLK